MHTLLGHVAAVALTALSHFSFGVWNERGLIEFTIHSLDLHTCKIYLSRLHIKHTIIFNNSDIFHY